MTNNTGIKESLEFLKKAFFATIISFLIIILLAMLRVSGKIDFLLWLQTAFWIYIIAAIYILIVSLSGFSIGIQAVRKKVKRSNKSYWIIVGNFIFLLVSISLFVWFYIAYLSIKNGF